MCSSDLTREEAASYGTANGFSDANYSGPLQATVFPQLYRLKGSVVAPTVPMVRTASCEVTVVDEDGQPLTGAKVDFSPVQSIFNQGTNVVGTSSDCLKLIRDQLTTGRHRIPTDEHPISRHYKSYSAETNARGIAIVSDLPLGGAAEPTTAVSYRFGVTLKGYRPTWPALESPTTSVNLMPGQTGQALVRLKKL